MISTKILFNNFSFNDIPLFKYESINNKTLIETIIKKDIDWLFVIGWSQIASKDFLNSTKYKPI